MGRSTVNLQTLITRNSDMTTGVVEEDVMMMSIETGRYYQLNPMGGEIWNIMETPLTVAELCDILESRFAAARNIIEREVIAYIEKLAARKIVTIN